MSNYAEEQYIKNGFTPTPEPQSLVYKAAKAQALLNDPGSATLEHTPTQVRKVDGQDVVVPGTSPSFNVAQLVDAEDYLALTGEEPPKYERCRFPGCTNEGTHRIVNNRGGAININSDGQVVMEDPAPRPADRRMSPQEIALAKAQRFSSDLGMGQVTGIGDMAPAVLMADCTLPVCFMHNRLPVVRKPRVEKTSGPFSSYIKASLEADRFGRRTQRQPRIDISKVDGKDSYTVIWAEAE